MRCLIFTLSFLLFISCKKEQKKYDLYHCDCPKEVLEMVDDESNVYWDCSWQASYNNGRVKLKLDEDGEILYITRTYPE
jgi:hypothetical protein